MSFETDNWRSVDDVTRALPHAVGPEKSILSSMLQDPQEFIPIAIEEGVSDEFFYLPSNSTLYGFLIELFSAGIEVELVSLIQRLLDRGLLDRCGGPSGVYDVYSYAPTPGHFRHHLQQVRDKLILRRMIQLGNTVIAASYDSPHEPQEALQEGERLLTAIAGLAHGTAPTLSLKSQLKESLEEYERRVNGEQISQGWATFPALDQFIKGLHPGRMYMFCAYPEGGKSTISSEILASLAIEGVSCAYLPLEGTEKDVITRMVIQTAGIVATAYTDPKSFAANSGGNEVTNLVITKIRRAIQGLAQSPLIVRRPANSRVATIISMIRRMHRESGVKVVVVDYAQRIKGSGKEETREAEATACSNALQNLACELGIAIIVPSQLNADGDTKHGAVWGEDADVVVRIVQDRNKDSEHYKRHLHIAIDKDRQNGSGGNRVPLVLDRETIRFVPDINPLPQEPKKAKFQR